MHVTLALSAAFWMGEVDQPNPWLKTEELYQLGKAIRMISDHVQNMDINDTVIAGTATLANVSVSRLQGDLLACVGWQLSTVDYLLCHA